MTPQDIITELNDHGFSDLGSTAQLRAINQSHRNICYRRAWPFLEKTLTLTFDGVNSTPSNAPTDLRAVKKIMDPVSGKRIRYMRTDDFEEQYVTTKTTVGTPILYYFVGSQLNVYQVPPATQTLYSRYLKTVASVGAADPESAFALPAEYHEAIVFRTLMRLYDLDDDSALSARFEAHYENVMAQMSDALLIQQQDEPEFIHSVDPDDFDYYWPSQ
jgi:hypothetical protein